MNARTRLQVILSDLHVLSTVGLWPPRYKAHEGHIILQNVFQELLWQHWKECQEWIARICGEDHFELILNGDLVDGIHHKTTQVMSADQNDQIGAVLEVLGPLAEKAAKIYLTKGTESHTRNDECYIGRELGAVQDPATGHHAWDRLELKLPTGKIFSASHHMPATKRVYLEASMMSIELQNEIMERVRCNKTPPDIVARAHRHTHGIYSNGRQMFMVTGAWQGLTRYGRKVVPHAIPSASCIILDSRNKKTNELPVANEKIFINE